jgi:hypothetical protein
MPRPRRRPKPDRRRPLELLAWCRHGCTEAIMLAHGFSMTIRITGIGVPARHARNKLDDPATKATMIRIAQN